MHAAYLHVVSYDGDVVIVESYFSHIIVRFTLDIAKILFISHMFIIIMYEILHRTFSLSEIC